jgi:hypothetical protein
MEKDDAPEEDIMKERTFSVSGTGTYWPGWTCGAWGRPSEPGPLRESTWFLIRMESVFNYLLCVECYLLPDLYLLAETISQSIQTQFD